MLRILFIFWREYWGNITRRSYLIFTFGFPIFMIGVPILGAVLLTVAIISAMPPTNPLPIGVVDQAELLVNAKNRPREPVRIIFFDDTQAATSALQTGDIQAYYHLAPNYWQTGEVTVTYDQAPTAQVDQMLIGWINRQIRAKAPPDVLARFDRGAAITHHGVGGATAFSASDVVAPVVVYLLIYFVRLASSFTASYMFDSIASEADDRTLEIMITTVSPFQFVTGKLLGLLMVGLTQIGMWGGAILLITISGSWLLGVNLLDFLLSWEHLQLLVVVLGGAYLLDQILAAALGLLRVSGGAGNLLFSTMNAVIGVSLIYAAYFVPRNPDSVVAVAASLFPLTSPLVLLIRVVVSQVPFWQISLGVLLLWGTNFAGLFWLRQLLKANLVAGSRSIKLGDWLKTKLPGWANG